MIKRIFAVILILSFLIQGLCSCQKATEEDAFSDTVVSEGLGFKEPPADSSEKEEEPAAPVQGENSSEKEEEKSPAVKEEPKEDAPASSPNKKEELPKEEPKQEQPDQQEEPKEEPMDQEPQKDILYQKTALFVGDSICHGSRDTANKGAWAGRIAEETGLIATNNGKSGTSLSDTRKNRFGLIHEQLLQEEGKAFDYVVLHGGVNDAWDNVPVGSCSTYFDPSSFNCDTFAGGLERLLYTATTLFGEKAAIGYLINFKAPSCSHGTVSDMSEYVAVAKKICDKWGVAYLDMYHHQELTLALQFHTTAHTTDFIHPNPEGYDILTPYIADFMRSLTPYEKVY